MTNTIMDIELTAKGIEYIRNYYRDIDYLLEQRGREHLIKIGLIKKVPEEILKQAWVY